MKSRSGIGLLLVARDPGRARLIAATAVACGVALSALSALVVIQVLHGETALLAMAIFLSVQAGNVVADRSRLARLETSALLAPSVVAAIVLAAVLASNRLALIAVFVVVAGAAIWVRRFGPRGAAIGSMFFMGYFFTLFMRPTQTELPEFLLTAVGAVLAQVLVRIVLLAQRPGRQLAVLLRELRAATAAAALAADRPRHARRREDALLRMDDVSRAITAWQQRFPTDHYVGCDERTLDDLTLDARIQSEIACMQIGRAADSRVPGFGLSAEAATVLATVLDEHSSSRRLAGATRWADDAIAYGRGEGQESIADYAVALAARAHLRLRAVTRRRAAEPSPRPRATPAPPIGVQAASQSSPPLQRTPGDPSRSVQRAAVWRHWAPTTRMAVQVMIAAAIAAGVGEAISATRWYWAVMTAFIVFIGASTRGGILTRASRRVIGTVLGIAAGVGVVALIGHDTPMLVAVSVIAVFGMLYLGKVNYVYSALFMTVMLVALYRMMGVLDAGILELRLVETVTGAIVGVLCAYLILSSSSRPAIVTTMSAFFYALEFFMSTADAELTARRKPELSAPLHRMDAALADVDSMMSATATAFLVTGQRATSASLQLLHVTSRSAALFVQAVREGVSDGTEAVTEACGHVHVTITLARRVLARQGAPVSVAPGNDVLDLLARPGVGRGSVGREALIALAGIDWAMHRLAAEAEAPQRSQPAASNQAARRRRSAASSVGVSPPAAR